MISTLGAFATPNVAADSVDLLDLSIKELLQLKVTVASAFPEEPLEASSSVTVIERDQWLNYASRSVYELAQHIPSTMNYATLGSGGVAIRGYGNTSSGLGVATLLDGVPINSLGLGSSQYHMSNLALETFDRIEVVRGPGSALYGSDAFHGVLAQTTYSARQAETQLSSEFDNKGYYQLGLRGALDFGADQFLSLALSTSGQPGQDVPYVYTDPATATEMDSFHENRYKTISLSLRYDHTNDGDGWFYSGGLYLNEHDGDDFPGTGVLFGSSQQRDREHIDLDSSFYLLRGNLGYRFSNDIQLEWQSFYWTAEMDHELDFSRVNPSFLGGVAGIQLTRDEEDKWGNILTLRQRNSRFNTDWALVLSWLNAEIDDNRSQFFSADGNTLLFDTISQSTGAERVTKAVVFQAKSWLGADESWALLYGGRLDDFSDVGSEASPRIGVIHHWSDSSAWKLLYGEAFRPPTANELNGVGVAPGNPNLKPETINTVELIYMFRQEKVTTEAVLFHSDWEDSIVLDGNFANSGVNKATGIELIGELQTSLWNVSGSVSYIESENTSSNIKYSAFPKAIVNLDVAYFFPDYNMTFTLANRFNYDVDEGPVVAAAPNPDQLRHYWRTDFILNKQLENNSNVYFSVLNVFDRENYLPSIWNTENGLRDQQLRVQLGVRYQLK